MPYNLRITFGGICLLVQQTDGDNQGLWVLMPDMSGHGMEHCRLMITHPANSGEANDRVVPLAGMRHEDQRRLAPPRAPITRPANVLEISRYANLSVNPACFSDDPPGCLGWRIALPLGSTVTPSRTSLGRLHVPNPPCDVPPCQFTSLVDVVVQVTTRDDLEIAGKVLQPFDGTITLSLMNVPFSELLGDRVGSQVNMPAHHTHAYYSLLGDSCDTTGPAILHGEDSDPKGANSARCPTEEQDLPRLVPVVAAATTRAADDNSRPAARRGVDPNNCTIGWGCAVLPC